MRTFVNAVFLALCVVPSLGIATASAADLDHLYQPPPPRYLPPPPPCEYGGPCLHRYRPPLAFLRPRYYYYGHLEPDYHHVYDPYTYDHDGYGRPRQNIDRYGYDRPAQTYEHLGYDRLDRYGDQERRGENERYERRNFPPYGYPPG